VVQTIQLLKEKRKKTAQKFKDFSTLISFKLKVNLGIPEE